MQYFRGWAGAAVALLAGAAAMLAMPGTARAVVTQGQVDDFEDGTLLGWHTGPNNFTNRETNVATGGPAGANDNFMRLSSNGIDGSAGGKLLILSGDRWAGNFVTANVNEIEMQVNSFTIASPPPGGQATLDLRLVINGTAGTLSTVADVLVAPGSGWTTIHFPLTTANLTGTGSMNAVLSDVFDVELMHSNVGVPLLSRQSSPVVVAELGVDNIRAVTVPEPGMVGVAGMIMVAATGRGRWRRQRAS